MRYTTRPITDWTAFSGEHKPSPFKSSWSDTLDLLDRELYYLNAEDIVIEVDCTERDIRIDGMLRSNARVDNPAVRIAFDSKHGPLTYATDRYISPSYRRTLTDWQHNVRAIALGLEALRRVDRYAITQRGEQYRGFKAIEATPMNGMTREAAARLLERLAVGDEGDAREQSVKIILNGGESAMRCWREARATAHPDRRDGDHALWHEVEQAARVLGLVGA